MRDPLIAPLIGAWSTGTHAQTQRSRHRERAAHLARRARAARSPRGRGRDDPVDPAAALGAHLRRDAAARPGRAEARDAPATGSPATTRAAPSTSASGPPAPLMRLLVAPVLVLSTLTLFGNGRRCSSRSRTRGAVLGLHKASFIVWFGAMAIHVLAYTVRALKRVRCGPLGPPHPRPGAPRRGLGARRRRGGRDRGRHLPAGQPLVPQARRRSSGTAPSSSPPGRPRPFARLHAADRPGLARARACRPSSPGPLPGYLLIADRNNNRALIVSPAGKVVWTRLRAPRPRRRVLHARLALDHHERGVQRHAGAGRASRAPHRLALRPRRHRRLLARLPEHPRRRLPPPERRHDGRGHQELPHRRALPARDGRPDPRRQLRPRPAARLLEPERRHAAPGRRPARHRDRRLDRPARRARPPRLVGALSGLVPLRRPAPAERPHPRLVVHLPRAASSS